MCVWLTNKQTYKDPNDKDQEEEGKESGSVAGAVGRSRGCSWRRPLPSFSILPHFHVGFVAPPLQITFLCICHDNSWNTRWSSSGGDTEALFLLLHVKWTVQKKITQEEKTSYHFNHFLWSKNIHLCIVHAEYESWLTGVCWCKLVSDSYISQLFHFVND